MAEYYTHTVKRKGRVSKGHFGYISYEKKVLLIRTLILAAGVAGLVVIGYIVTKTTKNLLSVAAILTAVPMAMQFATLASYLSFKGRSHKEYQEIKEIVKDGVMDAELVIAKKDGKSIPVNYACFTEDEVLVYTSDTTLDRNVYTEYLHTFLRLSQADCTICLFNDLSAFKEALKKREFTSRDDIAETVLEREGVFRAVSM